ncbi:solute carrier organic anion transporter family member 2B1 [Ctenopharyngodon idella]|uniref:solute carrier organic anion transporter family member 2B1 n=1 Tax=Ctenopharyngodon idella TaxID=7959 RepID=UPI0022308E71|nr:solute carrier organic anion transporter family member 2B1 [Ctenopharyngodon idella]XP_051732995.1 solute carrier organic anion transporter family member 2B1 [Ctenopharyngodon idella]
MTAIEGNPQTPRPRRSMGLFNNIKFFVLCHGMLQLSQLLVSGYLKGSITTIERRYGFSSQKMGLLAAFNEVGNTVLIVFVSFFGSRVHRPRCIGIGAMIASMGVFLIALPHFIDGKYNYTGINSNTKGNGSSLCQSQNISPVEESDQKCNQNNTGNGVYPIFLLGQLLLGIGGVPIQPFGISYIDDFAEKRSSPFYLGILFAVTVIGPAFGYMMSSAVLRFFVDVDKMSLGETNLKNDDPRWVGAWWLGFLIAATLLLLTSLPYMFFPRKMSREETEEAPAEPSTEKMMHGTVTTEEVSLTEFLKSFPRIVMRTLRNPIYLLVVLAQVNLAAMVAGLATFMGKFIEKQFAKTSSFSNMMIGGINIPSAMLGIMAGGVILRRFGLSVRSSAVMCTIAVFVSIMFATPLLFIGCPTQNVSEINVHNCSEEAFNPVCVSNRVEFRSPCHAGCKIEMRCADKVLNYTDCGPLTGFASPGPCDNGCNNRLIPFMILSSITCFVASLSHTTSFMMILRTVTPEDKSFALGIQFMLFRVLAFLPAPVLYGRAIDTACRLWGKKCNTTTSCHYYNLDMFRHRFIGLQIFFICGGFVCFFLSFMVLRRINSTQQRNEKMNNQIKSESSQEMKDVKQMVSKSNGHCNTQRVLRK